MLYPQNVYWDSLNQENKHNCTYVLMCYIASLVAGGKNGRLAKILLSDGLIWGASSDLQMEKLFHQLKELQRYGLQ